MRPIALGLRDERHTAIVEVEGYGDTSETKGLSGSGWFSLTETADMKTADWAESSLVQERLPKDSRLVSMRYVATFNDSM